MQLTLNPQSREGVARSAMALALSLLMGPAVASAHSAYIFGKSHINIDSMNGTAEGAADVLRSEAGINLNATAQKATNPATKIIVADKDFSSPATFNAETYQLHRPMFSFDVFKAITGKKPETSPIVILSTDAAAKKAQLVNVDNIVTTEASARLLQAVGVAEVKAVYVETEGVTLDEIDAMAGFDSNLVATLKGKGVVIMAPANDEAHGNKRVVTANDDGWKQARAKMFGNKNLLAGDRVDSGTLDFDTGYTSFGPAAAPRRQAIQRQEVYA